ncbi:hypothetical protein L195_g032810 [Trifolium pratense]|uniref:Uncharacterized protein n=1 Tax=Trifolium pratense TaxID=57577 RepID=A0A2K3LE78_TRIPR|nr:hypothetical protein L195_g032810 [Trifolium pratense]
MNPPEFPSGGTSTPSPKKEIQIQGTRPPPLRVSKDSHTITKPPRHPAVHHHPPAGASQHRQPLIIYSVSPKVLHRLTGPSAGEEAPQQSGAVSPAARLASIERTSPTERERVQNTIDEDLTWLLEGFEMGQFPGILSPAPATLPPISQGYFSPMNEPQTTPFWHDMSPFWYGNSFVASPSGLLSATVVSPLPSPDLFSIFD